MEVTLSVYAGLSNGDAVTVALMNGGLAAALAIIDSLLGYYIIELFIVPFSLALAWTLAQPICLLVKLAKIKASRFAIRATEPVRSARKTRPVSSIVGAVDKTFFQPLRDLDALLLRHLRNKKTKSDKEETKGELVCSNSN